MAESQIGEGERGGGCWVLWPLCRSLEMALEWEWAPGSVSAVSQWGSACRVSNLWYSEIGSVEADGNAAPACPSLGSPVPPSQPAPRPHGVVEVKAFRIFP